MTYYRVALCFCVFKDRMKGFRMICVGNKGKKYPLCVFGCSYLCIVLDGLFG